MVQATSSPLLQKSMLTMKKIGIVTVFILEMIAGAQGHRAHQRHWQLTDTETLWVGRYSNCQYGYYFLLPRGTIAHAEHPPSPHHGFMVSLPDVGLRTEVTVDNAHLFVWVNAEYNVTEESTLSGISDYYIDLTGRDKRNFRLVERHKTRLRSVSATRFKSEYDTGDGRLVEEKMIALRSGIVYEVGLRTSIEDYTADRKRLEQILAGFRFSRIPERQCWNY